VVVFGEASTGKTCFTDVFLTGKPFVRYDPTQHSSTRTITLSNSTHNLSLTDLSSTPIIKNDIVFPTSLFRNLPHNADGIVLLYDITDGATFDKLTTVVYQWLWTGRSPAPGSISTQSRPSAPKPTAPRRFGCVLVGTKADVVSQDPSKRQVSRGMAEQWAQSQGFRHFEVDTRDRTQVEGAVEGLVRSIGVMRRRDAMDLEKG
ncbi:P-loop containing nucleoside triphosphate hydrolase protein, partial [Pyrenochaeta sp. DS3sAY3a]